MRIEYVVPALPAAGMEMVVARLTRGFARRGHDVGVTCIQGLGPIAEELAAAGYRVTLVPAPGLRSHLFPLRLRSWLNSRRPDVVHVHSGAWLKSVNAATAAGVPRIVYSMHGIDGTLPWHDRILDRLAARRTDTVVAVTPALLEYLLHSARVPRHRLHVVMNGIDVHRFQPGPRSDRIRSQLNATADDVVIGHVARFMPVKNHLMLLHAMARVAAERSSCRLALVGDGVLRPQMEEEVRRLGLEDRVTFLGHLQEIADVYRDFDIAVLSSTTEATSISILEAMASGLPVVATAVGGTPELLGDGAAGVLVPADDADEMAAALIRLADSAAERARLGDAARNRVVERYGEDRMLDAYEAIYLGQTDRADRDRTANP